MPIGPDKFVTMWLSILAYEVMGTPFSYRKFKGGLSVDYVGYHLEYDRHVAGISTKRAEWILQWIDTLERNGWMVQGRAFIEFTGRLSFVARVVTWLKPFMAPLFAWSSVLARGTVMRVPVLVYVTLRFLKEQLQRHGHWVNATAPWFSPKEAFRTDAKCESGRIVLAGWSTENGVENLKLARWVQLGNFPGTTSDALQRRWRITVVLNSGGVTGLLRCFFCVWTFGEGWWIKELEDGNNRWYRQ